MAEAKWKAGDRAVYRGVMEQRSGQEVEIVCGLRGTIAVLFDDGVRMSVSPASLRAPE